VINADRRAEYLVEVTAFLIANLEEVVNEWAEGENYDDIARNFEGVSNLYYGEYNNTISGPSFADLVAQADPDTAELVDAAFVTAAAAVTAATTGDNIPFDFAIAQGEGATEYDNVEEAFNALQDLGDQLVAAAGALEVTISAALPE